MITFDQNTHTYWSGLDQLISVTQLLSKHGITTDYSAVPEDVLTAAAEKGSAVHLDIEHYVKGIPSDYQYPNHVAKFEKLCKENNLVFNESELVVGNDLVAGTVDLLGCCRDGECIADIKTGSVLNLEACRWQLTLYDYLGQLKNKHFYVLHITDTVAKCIEVDPIPLDRIEELLEAESEGEYLSTSLAPSLVAELQAAEQKLADLEERKAAIKEESDNVKSILIESMQRNGIKKYENDFLSITYVAPQQRISIDTTKLKKDLPEVAEQYAKTSTVKASIRVTLKQA